MVATRRKLSRWNGHVQNTYSRQAGFEIEQQLWKRAIVSVGYQGLRGLDLLISVNQTTALGDPRSISAVRASGSK